MQIGRPKTRAGFFRQSSKKTAGGFIAQPDLDHLPPSEWSPRPLGKDHSFEDSSIKVSK